MELIKKKTALARQLQEKTAELKKVHTMLINTCDVQKITMQCCLDGMDEENECKEDIENNQLRLKYILNWHYNLMFNDAIRTPGQMNENRHNSYLLVDRIIEVAQYMRLVHIENRELEKRIEELDKDRSEFTAETDALVEQLNKIKDKMCALDTEIENAGLSIECDAVESAAAQMGTLST